MDLGTARDLRLMAEEYLGAVLTWQNLFCTNCSIPRFDLGLVEQDYVQQGILDFQLSVVNFRRVWQPNAAPVIDREGAIRARILALVDYPPKKTITTHPLSKPKWIH
jgi:hypothetical protein